MSEISTSMMKRHMVQLAYNENYRIVQYLLLPENIKEINQKDSIMFAFCQNANDMVVDYFILNNIFHDMMYYNKNPRLIQHLIKTRPTEEIIDNSYKFCTVPDLKIIKMIEDNIDDVYHIIEDDIADNPHPYIVEFCIKYADRRFDLDGIYANEGIFDKNKVIETAEEDEKTVEIVKFTDTHQKLKNKFCSKLPTHSNNRIDFNHIISVELHNKNANSVFYKTENEGKYRINIDQKYIGKGTYGAVYNGTMNGVQMVIKNITIPISKLEYVLSETIIQGHLACEHNEYLKEIGGFIIPEIYFIANVKNSDAYFIGMEKLDGSLYDFIRTVKINKDTKSEYMYKCILNLSKTLYVLQKYCNFMHRDLHIGNIMFKGDLDDLDNLKWYIIDFGFSYVDIKQTFYKDNKSYTISKDIIAIDRFPNSKLNPSQDLRILFLSLIEYNEVFNAKFNSWMTDHLMSVSTYLPEIRPTIFHNAYEGVYHIEDPNLTPINILKDKKPIHKYPIRSIHMKLTNILSPLWTKLVFKGYNKNPFESIFKQNKKIINSLINSE